MEGRQFFSFGFGFTCIPPLATVLEDKIDCNCSADDKCNDSDYYANNGASGNFVRRCRNFGDLRSGSIGGCGNGYDLGRGLWYPAILGNGEIILLVVDSQVSIRVSAFPRKDSVPDLRFLKECSSECILSLIGCLT